MGVNISRVKSLEFDKWDPEQIQVHFVVLF
jgi:hypothetical protein